MAIDQKTGRFLRDDPEKYFARHAEPKENGCIEWKGGEFQGGYGYFKCKAVWPTPINASRGSWMIHKGPVPEGLFVCHTCDNRKCVNPDHLFLGTCKENMEDCKAKGRMNKGEDRPQAKLTEEGVRQIRRLRQKGMGWRCLASRFGVGQNTIIRACTGETWAHVSEPSPTYIGKPGTSGT
jgi:hypothetical protein